MLGLPRNATAKAYLIELLIVIFGITVAFQIEKLDDNRREAAAHETLRQGLVSEIDLNLEELTDVLETGRNGVQRTTQVLELLSAEDPAATPDLEAALRGVAQVTLPEVQSGQLDAYLESDLSATSSARSELIALRARLAELEEVGTYRVNYMLEHFLPLLSPYYDFARATIMDADGIWDYRTRNAVGMLASLEDSHLQTQRAALCSLLRARKALDAAEAGPTVHDGSGFDDEECREEA